LIYCVLLPILTGCFLVEVTVADGVGKWHEIPTVKLPLDQISRIVHERVASIGYAIPKDDPKSGRIDSDWIVTLSPRWREGYRTRIEIAIAPLDTGGASVRIRSRREFNDNGLAPMDLAKAQWVSAFLDEKHSPHVDEPAMNLHQMLKHRFCGISND
jgi:hypothetical protein